MVSMGGATRVCFVLILSPNGLPCLSTLALKSNWSKVVPHLVAVGSSSSNVVVRSRRCSGIPASHTLGSWFSIVPSSWPTLRTMSSCQ
ncbi:unnamed protein product [Brassica oleracea var. botrytis]